MEHALHGDCQSAVQALLAMADRHAHVCDRQHCNIRSQRSASQALHCSGHAFIMHKSIVYAILYFWLDDAIPSSSHNLVKLVSIFAGFASQSLLTGLGSVQFVSNLAFVMLVLKEKVPPRCVLATFFIVVGNIVLVVFGNKASPKFSVTELAGLYRKDATAAYMIMAYAGGMSTFAA